MPARSITCATARWPISRYGVCSRCKSASIIEFSKWVRRHQVTKELGSPPKLLAFRKGVAIATSPPCMSTTVPYWSNMQTLTLCLIASGVMARSRLSFALDDPGVDPGDECIQHLDHDIGILASRARRHMKGVIGARNQVQRRA